MNARTLIAVAAVVVVAALFFVFRPEGDDAEAETVVTPTTVATTGETETSATTEAAPTTQSQLTVRWSIDTRDDRIDRLRVRQGSIVQLIVEADASDHVHVHGYDLMRDVAPGTPAQIRFQATLTGRFEIELEDAGQDIALLTVVP